MNSEANLRPAVARVAALALWPVAFVFACLDWLSLDGYDLGLLSALTFLSSWATVTQHRFVKRSVGIVLLGVVIFLVTSYESVLRAVLSQAKDTTSSFGDGAMAKLRSIKPFRPYIIVATLGLFSIGISSICQHKNKT